MKIGLIIAIARELEAFLQSGENRTAETVAGRTVYHTVINGHEIYAVQSGCGEIDAAAAAMLLIARFDCDTILNFGVTGALEEDLRVEDLFVVEKVCHYDYDTSPIDPVVPGQYTEYPDAFIPLSPDLVRLAQSKGLRCVAAASGDKFVEDRTEKLRLRALGCSICDMEIAAIARTCERCGVRCLSVKCISDTFDGNGGDFTQNVARSAEKAFRALREIICIL